MLKSQERSLLDDEDAVSDDDNKGVAEPPRWWNRELGKATARVGTLRKEVARLQAIVDANECKHAALDGASASWQVARRLERALRSVTNERDALLVEIRPYRVRAFCEEHGLPANVAELIGDRDPGEWLAEYGETLTITKEKRQQ